MSGDYPRLKLNDELALALVSVYAVRQRISASGAFAPSPEVARLLREVVASLANLEQVPGVRLLHQDVAFTDADRAWLASIAASLGDDHNDEENR